MTAVSKVVVITEVKVGGDFVFSNVL